MTDGFSTDERGERAAFGQGPVAKITGEKTSGPGIACAVRVNHVRHDYGFDAVKLGVACDPGAVATHLDGGEDALSRETLREDGIVGRLILIERADFVFVGEDHVDAFVQLGKDPIAGHVDHFERSEIKTDGTTSGAGGGENGVGESLVENEVAFHVDVTAAGEISGGDFGGRERHRGGETGAHRAIRVRRDEDERAGVRKIALLEVSGVDADGLEGLAVTLSEVVVAELAEKRCAQAETRGVEGGVGGRSTG